VISKEEFAKIVKDMQASGKPLTVRNLMVQTELPRATVEQWLEDLQGNADLVPKAEPKKAPTEQDAPRKKLKEKTRGEDDESIFSQVNALKDQVVGDVVKSQLGIKDKSEQDPTNKKSIATGAILGLLFPPAAFAYAAPILEGLLGGVIYFAFAFISYYIDKIPGLGRMITTPLFLALHLVGAAAGLAYAFRYNRNGKRVPLLPKGRSKSDEE
jgi:hypothetical protein